MEWPILVGIVGVVLVLVLLVLGLHVALTLGLVGFLGLWVLIGFPQALKILQLQPFEIVNNFNYTVLPLFIVMGAFLLHSGIAHSLYGTTFTLFERFPGGSYLTVIMSCAAFGAVSGSSMATCAVFTKLALGEMIDHGSSKSIAAGSIAAAGGLAALIPPSGLMIIYSVFADQSIGRCQMAGLLPGILTAVVLSSVVLSWVKLRPDIAPHVATKATSRMKWQSLPQLWPLALLVMIIWGGMYTGVFTANEAAAVGAFVAFVLLVWRQKKQAMNFTAAALFQAAYTTGMLFLIIVGALLFSRFMAVTRVSQELANLIVALPVNRLVILTFFLLLYLVLGMFLEGVGMMALTFPFILPVMEGLGFDLIWFGVIMVIMIEVGFITPPVGLNVFAVKAAAGDLVGLNDIFKGMVPFLGGYLIVIVVLIAFPSIATWIPSMMVM